LRNSGIPEQTGSAVPADLLLLDQDNVAASSTGALEFVELYKEKRPAVRVNTMTFDRPSPALFNDIQRTLVDYLNRDLGR
jgi:hypothetical protein